MARRFTYRVPLMKESGARRFIYCVPLMEDRSGLLIYIMCAPNGRKWVS